MRAVLARVFRRFIRRTGAALVRITKTIAPSRFQAAVTLPGFLLLLRPRASGELGCCAAGGLSAACLRVVVSQSRHRAGDVARRRRAGGLQPRLSSSRRAGSQGRAAALPTCRRFGAARRACQREEPAVRCFFGRTKSGSSFLQKIMKTKK